MDVSKLKEAIEKSGLTQTEVAKELGISLSAFRRRLRTNAFGLIEAKVMVELLGIENPDKIFFDK